MLAFEVGSLWRNPDEGETFSGWITLPWSLPAGTGLKAILIPQPLRRSPKEKFVLHLEMPLIESSPETEPDDIKGERMNQWFRPPKASNRRNKILIWGLSGSAKTKSALEFPGCAYIDNHGSAEKYESAYPQHLFFGSATELPTPDNTMAAVTSLLGDPGDRRTLVLDDITTYWDQVQTKWGSLFLARLPKSPGHHAEFYTFQPSDWQYPKKELRSLLRRMIALDTNVIVIARAAKEYKGEGTDYMKVVGEIFAGEKNIVYEFDYVFQFVHEGGKYQAITHKQRVTPGEKPMPDSFEFTIDKKGRSTFYDEFSKYVDKAKLNAESHRVTDPVRGEAEEGKDVVTEKEKPATQPSVADIATAEPPQTIAMAAPPTEKLSPITEDQLNKIVELKGKIAISKETWAEYLKKYSVSTARDLSKVQGEDFIAVLEALFNQVPF
jgi:hypothetical protein